jgi:mRNA-degrading endonuclease RelE of RelBE toxin-antitoxin system
LIRYLNTTDFIESLEELTNRKNSKYYGNLFSDIKKEIAGKSIQDLILMSDLIYEKKPFHFRKLRFSNSKMNTSKQGGFRLYFAINIDAEKIIFVEVYPKKGNKARIDLSQAERATMLENLMKDITGDHLNGFLL